MTYDLSCLGGNTIVNTIACINTNSGGFFAGAICLAIYFIALIAGSYTDYFANALLATSAVMTIITGLLWVLFGLQWWIVVLNFSVLVLSIIYKVWWRNE